MTIIDILVKIATDKEVPKKIKVYNDIYEYDSRNKMYWNSNKRNLLDVYNGYILNYEVEIIKDTPKEDKKIEKIKPIERKARNITNQYLKDKLNEIINKINGE